METPRIVDPRVLREVLGHFASGVTVVTAVTDDGPIGFTCQSFSSLSLDPPLVAFAPARTSRTWTRLRELGRFCVNVLAEGQDGGAREKVAAQNGTGHRPKRRRQQPRCCGGRRGDDRGETERSALDSANDGGGEHSSDEQDPVQPVQQ